jgi:hypothetical protein
MTSPIRATQKLVGSGHPLPNRGNRYVKHSYQFRLTVSQCFQREAVVGSPTFSLKLPNVGDQIGNGPGVCKLTQFNLSLGEANCHSSARHETIEGYHDYDHE